MIMDKEIYKLVVIENSATVFACAICVVGLAAYADGVWGWGFLILLNLSSYSSKKS